jgi:lysosomal alpha-mannosidase
MVHRRTLYDDAQGVHEPMNETAYGTGLVIRGQHFLVLEPPEYSALYHRPAAQHIFLSPLGVYALPNVSYADYSANYRQTWSAVSEALPLNVHLLTFDQLTSKTYLVRIEHYFELNEDESYSKPVQFDLQSLFNALGKVSDSVELTLAGNLPLSEMNRLVWRTNDNESSYWKPTGMTIKFV